MCEKPKAECPADEEEDEPTRCKKCKIVFRSGICYENHVKRGPNNGKSRCDLTKFCKNITRWCSRCQRPKLFDHECVMAASVKNEEKLKRLRCFFDIESKTCPSVLTRHPQHLVVSSQSEPTSRKSITFT
ncbi:hypothetical protein B9Z55_015296 [Caenorhabditis nigoni]|uniref:Uncharacterized protein n=1 Tax=Caenorhabditis nigoni TaxID=1611254 RepID=A0A2G5U9N1_9PELO|nr:hypothetical protein B9Z55_015296 [Caenorhabditis nigoni]